MLLILVKASLERMNGIVLERFFDEYKCRPDFIVRAPGRVNLIGEHIDYNGYRVLPMAVKQSVYCAVKVAADVSETAKCVLHLKNVDSSKYGDFETEFVDDFFNGDKTTLKWYKYFLCGVQGCLEKLAQEKYPFELRSLKVMIGGDIPASSGLSSSSALVCAAFMSTLKALTGQDFELVNRAAIADLCAKCERYIGTEGGGMDQAICLLAKPGQAQWINFSPLRSEDIPLPGGMTFLITNSCVESNKAATRHFNERVVECHLATKIMARKLNFSSEHPMPNFADLQTHFQKSTADMLNEVDRLLTRPFYTVQDCADESGAKIEDILEMICSKLKVDEDNARMLKLKLNQRAKHVYSESERVLKFVLICSKYDDEKFEQTDSVSNTDTVLKLGRLMNESHESCRDWYECSCPELDSLQKFIISLGAFGSRLTGAGWGGCLVSLIDSRQSDVFVQKLRQSTFYENFDRDVFLNNVFVTEPSSGAEIRVLD